jgi:ABC-type phosphate/phosphonate transport system ATPase subunit
MPELLLPVTFRREILEPVIDLLRMGESCALVGVGSSGKSNIARHLTRADVRLSYFEERAPNVFVLYVNCKPLAHHSASTLSASARSVDAHGRRVKRLLPAAAARVE